MADARTDMLEERIDRLEKKVDDGFARVDEQFARVDRRFDEVYQAMSQGFAEHRQLLIDQMDPRVEPLRRDIARLDGKLAAHVSETGARFDRLESKLDAFMDSQSAVNRRLLDYLDRPGT